MYAKSNPHVELMDSDISEEAKRSLLSISVPTIFLKYNFKFFTSFSAGCNLYINSINNNYKKNT